VLLHPSGGVSAGFFERINHESGKSPYYSFRYFFFHSNDIQHTHTHTYTHIHTHCMHTGKRPISAHSVDLEE
jgi:hypothetical protein